jgi:hypothetical protein
MSEGMSEGMNEKVTTQQAVEILEEQNRLGEMTLREALHEYDIVDIHYEPGGGSHVVLSERESTIDRGTGFREMGFVDPSPFTAWTRLEHVSELRERRGIRTYYDMARSDGTIRAALRILKTPIQGADWYIESASDSVIDRNIADFVANNLFEELDTTWERVVEDCLRMLDYGFFPMEKVYKIDGNRIKLERLAPIHPLDVQLWEYDPNGRVTGLTMEPLTGIDRDIQPIHIPYSKLLMFVFEMEGSDLRGTSVLRSAYKHFYYKDILYKLDAIQKERHGIGVPCIKLPVGYSKEDKEIANELGRNLRTNERAFIVAPLSWEIGFAKIEGQPVDCIPSINHHDQKIMQNIMATFTANKTEEMTKESLDTFYKSTRYIANGGVAAVFNKFLIKELVDMNFLRKSGFPKLRVRRMGEWEDTRTMTFALRNLVGAKFITPDDPTEVFLRKLLSLPEMDKATARGMEGPLADPSKNVDKPEVGLPKQQPKPPIQPPALQAGADRSGGD